MIIKLSYFSQTGTTNFKIFPSIFNSIHELLWAFASQSPSELYHRHLLDSHKATVTEKEIPRGRHLSSNRVPTPRSTTLSTQDLSLPPQARAPELDLQRLALNLQKNRLHNQEDRGQRKRRRQDLAQLAELSQIPEVRAKRARMGHHRRYTIKMFRGRRVRIIKLRLSSTIRSSNKVMTGHRNHLWMTRLTRNFGKVSFHPGQRMG